MVLSLACGHAASGPRPAYPWSPTAAWPAHVRRTALERLLAHRRPQQTDSSCSAAALALVLNAMRSPLGLAPIEELTVRGIDPSGHFFAATEQGGSGVDLDTLRYHVLLAAGSLRGPRAAPATVDVVHVPAEAAPGEQMTAARQAFAYVLGRAYGASEHSYVVLNALQAKLVRGGEPVGHFVVVGAYDEARERLLILDVDNVPGLPPFWLSLDDAMRAMQTEDSATGEPRGYLWLRTGD